MSSNINILGIIGKVPILRTSQRQQERNFDTFVIINCLQKLSYFFRLNWPWVCCVDLRFENFKIHPADENSTTIIHITMERGSPVGVSVTICSKVWIHERDETHCSENLRNVQIRKTEVDDENNTANLLSLSSLTLSNRKRQKFPLWKLAGYNFCPLVSNCLLKP